MFKKLPILRVMGDSFSEELHPVVEEVPVAVIVNGRHTLTSMTSPVMLREFVIGYLYTERIIRSLDDIESIRIEDATVSVLTKNPFEILVSKKTVLSGCGGTSSFLDSTHLPQAPQGFQISPGVIQSAVKAGLESDLHVETGGIHIVGLFDKEGVAIRIVEDIGRHNALDRLIGFSLEAGIDLSGTFIICSGRISSEIARKCLIAGIPIVASRGATTTLAVTIAKQANLTLIGFVRSNRMNIYSGAERIAGAQTLSG
ncbi:formate dehydrogenase [Methanocalculus chunghsingensis]|uniref:Sulfur carrier protein FdhD n=2 Tax=Methanocalculus chunghsingensis TaxID=156457 RepID=A0A8J7W5Q4_9EURY|nr:formate dehydrogenase [Methanocalculus chunghsingensis]